MADLKVGDFVRTPQGIVYKVSCIEVGFKGVKIVHGMKRRKNGQWGPGREWCLWWAWVPCEEPK